MKMRTCDGCGKRLWPWAKRPVCSDACIKAAVAKKIGYEMGALARRVADELGMAPDERRAFLEDLERRDREMQAKALVKGPT